MTNARRSSTAAQATPKWVPTRTLQAAGKATAALGLQRRYPIWGWPGLLVSGEIEGQEGR